MFDYEQLLHQVISKQIGGKGLRGLINNAGVFIAGTIETVRFKLHYYNVFPAH
jgi:hypothetical protein